MQRILQTRAESSAVHAHLVHAHLAVNSHRSLQASGGGARPVQLLGAQEGFWPALAACVPPPAESSLKAGDPDSVLAEAWR